MKPTGDCVLAINSGSSSIRFAVFEAAGAQRRVLGGKIDRIGSKGAILDVANGQGAARRPLRIAGADHNSAALSLMDWLEAQPVFASVRAVGHRVVHGMRHSEPERVTRGLLRELRRITPYDPEHLPREVGLIEAFQRRHPKLPQVACFDTAFHRAMPAVARLLPIPRRLTAKGVERYGFHGLSYAYLMDELGRIDPAAAKGRVILAHLGNGASLAAVRGGTSVDTSMGFTPAAGLVMGTRTGDVDPGLAYFLSRTERMTAAGFQRMVFHESGLFGVSGTSGDVRDLCAREASDRRAREAVGLFCYQARKWIGSFAAVLGGVDTLVFSAGIGEHSPSIRRRICDGLGFLGIQLDAGRNARSAPLISARRGRAKVRVIHTEEELMISRSVARLLGLGKRNHSKP
jgi:acetate kinase